jgi:hypothetical protein
MEAFVRASIILPCLVNVALLGSACSKRDLSRTKAADLMNKEYATQLTSSCALDPALAKKTEFASITLDPVCNAEFVVTGIRKISETEAVAEAKAIQRSGPSVQKWLDTFESLEKRLLSLKGREVSTLMVEYWEFTDTSDGQKFISPYVRLTPWIRDSPRGQREDIKGTSQWKDLQKLKQMYINLSKKGELERDTIEQPFQLYDDGWRVVKNR